MAKTFEKTKAYKDVVKSYEKQLTATLNNLQRQADTAKAENTATAEKNVANAYKSYAAGQKSLDDSLKRQGITGGASETAKLSASNNLANVQAAYRNNANTNNATIDTSLAQEKETAKVTNEQNKATALDSARSNWATNREYNYNVKQDKLNAKNERNALIAQGYTTVESINKAIKNARKKGNTALIPYLMAQKGSIVASQE